MHHILQNYNLRFALELVVHLGFVFGAIGVGFIADLSSNGIAIQLVAWIAIATRCFCSFDNEESEKAEQRLNIIK